MSTYRTIDDIIAEKRDYIADYEAKIVAWGNVTIRTKKDGGELKELSNRCIDGAKMHGKGYTSGEEISVYYTGRRAYMDDSIDCYGFCDELPDGDERIDYSENDVIRLIKNRVEWLSAHNKNYTQAQWIYIQDIQDMLDAIEVL